jgi:hypothetical protein
MALTIPVERTQANTPHALVGALRTLTPESPDAHHLTHV